jgi:phosphoribosyl-AMP cyclohydrolase
MQSIQKDIRFINEVWGSEDALRTFLRSEVIRLLPIVCGDNFAIPTVDLRPTLMAKGVLPTNSGLRSGEYEPAEGDSPATIVLFPSVCADRESVSIAIAHELVHHWELSHPSSENVLEYPEEAEEVIHGAFKSAEKQRRWKAGHSAGFVTKAITVAKDLDVSLLNLLVHR